MKPIISVALFMLLSSSLIFTANAGTVTTTKTTTVTTVKKTSCYKKPKAYKKHRSYSRSTPSFDMYSASEARYSHQCPGGAFNCYYDLENNHYRETDLPVSHENNVRYSCVESEDPASCS